MEFHKPHLTVNKLSPTVLPKCYYPKSEWPEFKISSSNFLTYSRMINTVNIFLSETCQELKAKRKKTSSRSVGTPKNSESQTSRSVQLSIKEFYRSSKLLSQPKGIENLTDTSDSTTSGSSKRKSSSSQNFSKSARRRLLFG